MKKNISIKSILTICCLAVLALGSCKKYDNPAGFFEEYEKEGETPIVRKVLIISMDGGVGEEVKKVMPTTIKTLLGHSKYSFSALTEPNTSDASSWATIATGVGSPTHKITDDTFMPGVGEDLHGELPFYPSMFYRILEVKPSSNTAVFSRWSAMNNLLFPEATDAFYGTTDKDVKDKAVTFLKDKNAHLVVVNFQDVLNAGKSSGFLAANKDYSDAITRVDGYIGEVLAALNARENKAFEDWLIILTSSHGGIGNTYGGESFAERNVFSIYYHPDFKPNELNADLINSVRFHGFDGSENGPAKGVRARNLTAAAGEEVYNVGQTGELTVEAKIKINKNAAGNYSYIYPPFLSKVASRSGSTPGWSFFRAGNNINFWLGDGSRGMEISGGPVSLDDKWAHITGVFGLENGIPTAKFYVNGMEAAKKSDENVNLKNVTTSSPLTFGFQGAVFSGGFIDMQMADVHIWNKALTAAEILENSKRVGVPANHPKLENLVGNWPMDDGTNIFKNKVSGRPDIPIQGDYKYSVTGNNLPYVDENAILLQNKDIARQVYYWLHMTAPDTWKLEGQMFLNRFEVEFLK